MINSCQSGPTLLVRLPHTTKNLEISLQRMSLRLRLREGTGVPAAIYCCETPAWIIKTVMCLFLRLKLPL